MTGLDSYSRQVFNYKKEFIDLGFDFLRLALVCISCHCGACCAFKWYDIILCFHGNKRVQTLMVSWL